MRRYALPALLLTLLLCLGGCALTGGESSLPEGDGVSDQTSAGLPDQMALTPELLDQLARMLLDADPYAAAWDCPDIVVVLAPQESNYHLSGTRQLQTLIGKTRILSGSIYTDPQRLADFFLRHSQGEEDCISLLLPDSGGLNQLVLHTQNGQATAWDARFLLQDGVLLPDGQVRRDPDAQITELHDRWELYCFSQLQSLPRYGYSAVPFTPETIVKRLADNGSGSLTLASTGETRERNGRTFDLYLWQGAGLVPSGGAGGYWLAQDGSCCFAAEPEELGGIYLCASFYAPDALPEVPGSPLTARLGEALTTIQHPYYLHSEFPDVVIQNFEAFGSEGQLLDLSQGLSSSELDPWDLWYGYHRLSVFWENLSRGVPDQMILVRVGEQPMSITLLTCDGQAAALQRFSTQADPASGAVLYLPLDAEPIPVQPEETELYWLLNAPDGEPLLKLVRYGYQPVDAQDLNALLALAGYPPEEGYRLEYLSTGLENGRTVSSYRISDVEGRAVPAQLLLAEEGQAAWLKQPDSLGMLVQPCTLRQAREKLALPEGVDWQLGADLEQVHSFPRCFSEDFSRRHPDALSYRLACDLSGDGGLVLFPDRELDPILPGYERIGEFFRRVEQGVPDEILLTMSGHPLPVTRIIGFDGEQGYYRTYTVSPWRRDPISEGTMEFSETDEAWLFQYEGRSDADWVPKYGCLPVPLAGDDLTEALTRATGGNGNIRLTRGEETVTLGGKQFYPYYAYDQAQKMDLGIYYYVAEDGSCWCSVSMLDGALWMPVTPAPAE
ncbi:MAG: hypothetical protein KH009_08155 [Clostridiales bacterium]|nr:hypothetical protein [Clostridiales bacterium]